MKRRGRYGQGATGGQWVREGQRTGPNEGETHGAAAAATVREAKREGEVGQGGVWCQRPGGQQEEGHHAAEGGAKQDKEISRGVKDNSLEHRTV